MKKTLHFLTLTVLALLIFGTTYAETQKIALMPLKIHADKDLAYLQQGLADMFSSRLSGEGLTVTRSASVSTGNVDDAKALGEKLGVDHVLFGSLTVFGESVSVDVRVVSMAENKPPAAFFRQTSSMGAVIPEVNRMATEIGQQLTGKAPKPAPTAVVATVPAPTTAPKPFTAKAPLTAKKFWKSRDFKMEIIGLTAGDMDGNGRDEVAFIADKSLHIYRYERERFVKSKKIEADTLVRFLAVDAGDLNANGKAEVFVTALNTSTESLHSFVLEWDGKDFRKIAADQPWYLRVVPRKDEKPLLLGQKIGYLKPYISGVYPLAWEGNTLVEKDRLNLPESAMVFGVSQANLLAEEAPAWMHYDKDSILSVTKDDGEPLWKSEKRVGGSELFLDQRPGGERKKKIRFYYYPRLLPADLNSDGIEEVMVVKSEEIAWGSFKRYRRFGSSRLEALVWDGIGMVRLGGTRKITGYISDFYRCDLDGDGENEWIAATVSGREGLVSAGKSAIIAYQTGDFSE